MPELPEVETTVRGIAPHLENQVITLVQVRQPQLRWPVPAALAQHVVGQSVRSVYRRAKYILVKLTEGHIMLHLGMSGSLRLAAVDEPVTRHDHVEFEIAGQRRLRLRDPRRFGCVLWLEGEPNEHRLLSHLGMEPLTVEFDGNYLYRNARQRKVSIKNFIMDSRIVVGVGNIYASEALHKARINPGRAAGRISLVRQNHLAMAVRQTLQDAIVAGGTTLRDFTDGSGSPGYFKHDLQVYDREGLPCFVCGQAIARRVMNNRSTYYCKQCQT